MANYEKCKKSCSKFFVIPHRWILGVMGFFAIVNAYTMRVSLSVAITEMVVHLNQTDKFDETACPGENGTYNAPSSVTDSDKLYDWDGTTQGIILSSFFWGYTITHIPGGVLAEKLGGRYTLGLGLLSTAIFTLVTPWVAIGTGGNVEAIVALRVIVGLGEGVTYPAINALLAKWVPLEERSRIGSLVFAGSQMGTIISNVISGALIHATKDWASVFYLFGGLGLVWAIAWFLICYSTPHTHPYIKEEELKLLEAKLHGVTDEKKRTPWKAILTSVPLWALVAAQIGHDWGFYTMVTDLPKYMKYVLKFNVQENGLWSSLPYLVMWIVSMLSGWGCDWLIKKEKCSVTFARKLFTAIAALGPAVFIMIASYVGCDRMAAVAMFTIAMGLMGTFYCGMKVNALDLSPNFAGTLMAITNGLGAITGIITPYLTGALTKDHTALQWQIVLWISFGIFVGTTIVYVLFASGEEQWWNDPHAGEQNRVESNAATTNRQT